MNFSSVLIVTYGRSGSTLLQGVLNSIDGCLVRGENNNLCHGLFRSYEALIQTKKEFGGDESLDVTNPWYGAAFLDESKFIEDARQLVIHQLSPDAKKHVCIGFKEVRYLNSDLTRAKAGNKPRLHDFLDFLAKLFPNPAFIVLTRDHDQVTKSAWWVNKEKEQVIEQLKAFDTAACSYAQGTNNTFTVTYQDMVERTPRLKEMFLFLGAAYDEARLKEVLATKHSYTMNLEKVKSHNNIDTLPGAAPHRPQPIAKKERPKAALQIKGANKGLIQHVALDSQAGQLADTNCHSLTGVVVLLPQVDAAGGHLVAVDTQGEHRVGWGIASPKMAKKWPGNTNAAHARFKIDQLRFTSDLPATILLEDTSGVRRPLFRIERSDRNTTTAA